MCIRDRASGGSVGILGGLDDKPAEIKANGGAQPVAFPYSDFGVNQVGYCIGAHNDTIKNNADVAKRFMKATIESYAKAEKNPDAAVDAIADIVGGSMAEDAGKAQPFGRLLDPKEVAKAVTFLASDDSGMMTGSVVNFDQSVWGGYPFAPPQPAEKMEIK